MQSVRFVGVGRPPQIQEIPKPSPAADVYAKLKAGQIAGRAVLVPE